MKNIASAAEFEEVVKNNKLVLVDFYATWCGPCKLVVPLLQQLACDNPHIFFARIDIDEVSQIAEKYHVKSLPTIVVIKNGQEVKRASGVSLRQIELMVGTFA